MNKCDLKEGLVVRLRGQDKDLTVVNVTNYVFELGYFDDYGQYHTVTLPLSAAPAVYIPTETPWG